MQIIKYPETIKSLKLNRISKQDLFGRVNLEDSYCKSFDYALPQGWLDAFTEFCKQHFTQVTYDLIRGTCVWGYGRGSGPITGCYEVMAAHGLWEADCNDGEIPQTAKQAQHELDRRACMDQIKSLQDKLRKMEMWANG